MSSESQPSEHRFTLSVPIPREPSAYRMTEHFRFRKSRRENPSVDGEVIRRCIEDGRIKRTQSADRFIFEWEAGWTWWVIVELREEAFLQEAEKHRALTVFARDAEHDEPEWSP